MKKYICMLGLIVALCTACHPGAANQQASDTHTTDASTLPQGFVYVTDLIPDAILEIRYYSTYNFVGTRIDGYEAPQCILTREAAEALQRVNDELQAQGYALKLYDGYRPQRAVNHFIRWAEDLADTINKPCFYPEVDKRVLFKEQYICARSGHSRGSTIDLTLVHKQSGRELDMGGVFDYFGELSHPDYQGITAEQLSHRHLLRDAMLRNGFAPIDSEWWHFTLRNEPYPDTYFDFPIQ